MIHVALVTDRAGSFATVLPAPVPRRIEGGRILVTTLATFEHEAEAQAFLRGLQAMDMQQRERTPADHAALVRHGLAPARELTEQTAPANRHA
jgi:hypothetical protein